MTFHFMATERSSAAMKYSPSLFVRSGPTVFLMSTASNMIGTLANGLPSLSTTCPLTLVRPSAARAGRERAVTIARTASRAIDVRADRACFIVSSSRDANARAACAPEQPRFYPPPPRQSRRRGDTRARGSTPAPRPDQVAREQEGEEHPADEVEQHQRPTHTRPGDHLEEIATRDHR